MNFRTVDKSVWILAGRRGIMEDDLWGHCRNEHGFFDRMAKIDIEKPNNNLAYCIAGGSEGKSPWIVGVETTSTELDGLDVINVLESRWLVFEARGPMNPNFFNMQNEVYNVYFDDPAREYNWHDGMRSFEKYCTADVNSKDTLIELWCPVVKK
jgi:predicted transcriptional regulator YdeE